MSARKKVDLFIFGAPKCGTTAMVDYLQQHPAIFFPNIKEPHFFCSDFDSFRRIRKLDEYSGLFPFDDSEIKVFGEASVWYLYSNEAAQAVFEYNPDAKIVVMLRDPIEMLPSLHTQLIFSGRENISDFNVAWSAIDQRKKGFGLPDNVIEPSHIYYDDVCKYGGQLERLFSVFNKSQVKVIFYDDFKTNSQSCAQGVLRFLGLPDDFQFEVSIVNKARRHKYPRVSAFLRHPPFPFSILKNLIKQLAFVKKVTPMRKVYAALSEDADKVVLLSQTAIAIKDAYESDVKVLEKVSGRNLDVWLRHK